MENTHKNNPITNRLTMESTVEAILERARDDWGVIQAWSFFKIYFLSPYGMQHHPSVTMRQFLEEPETFVPYPKVRHHIQLNLNLKSAHMQKHLQRDLDKLKAAGIATLDEWQRLGATVDIGPMARMVLTRAFKQAMHNSPPKGILKKTTTKKAEQGM